MLVVIILVVVVVVGLYISPSETKGTLIWGAKGVRAGTNYAKGLRNEAKARAIANPEIIVQTVRDLDNNVVNFTKLHVDSTAYKNATLSALIKAQQAKDTKAK